MWTLAYALNKTLQGNIKIVYTAIVLTFFISSLSSPENLDLANNDTLNELAANASGIPPGQAFRLEHFTYNNSIVLEVIFGHLQETDFLGLTVRPLMNYTKM